MDNKGLCFVCDKELVGNGIQFNSSRTHIGNELLTQKIADLLGEDFVVIVNNKDRLCQDCVTQLNEIDMIEMDLKIVKNSLLSGIKNKYGGIPVDADDKIGSIMVEDGVLKADRSKVSNPSELEQDKTPSQILNIHQKVPTPPKVLMPRQVPWPQQILRPQLPQQTLRPQLAPRLAQSSQQELRSYPPAKRLRVMLPEEESKEIQVHNSQPKQQLFQNDIPTHPNKIEAVKDTTQKTARIFPVPQQKQIFKCKKCVKYFKKREDCLRHIQEYHNKSASITMEKKTLSPAPSNTNKCTPQLKFELNNQKPESSTDGKKEVTEEKVDAGEPQ